MPDNTITGVLIGAIPGLSGAFVVYMRSLVKLHAAEAKKRDAETAYLHTLIDQNSQKIAHLENGGGTAKVKSVLSEVGALTKDGVYGRRQEPLNPEQIPVPGSMEHAQDLVNAITGKVRKIE